MHSLFGITFVLFLLKLSVGKGQSINNFIYSSYIISKGSYFQAILFPLLLPFIEFNYTSKTYMKKT